MGSDRSSELDRHRTYEGQTPQGRYPQVTQILALMRKKVPTNRIPSLLFSPQTCFCRRNFAFAVPAAWDAFGPGGSHALPLYFLQICSNVTFLVKHFLIILFQTTILSHHDSPYPPPV